MLQPQHLRKAVDRGFDKTNARALAADAHDPQAARLGRRRDRLGVLMIDVDDRGTAWREQVVEQPQLGGEIGLESRVIIEMVPRDVGETSRRDAQTLKPVLV